MLTLTKDPAAPELNGPIEIRAEWNHSCTSQCSNPCPASSFLRPGIDVRMIRPGGDDPNGPAIPKIPDPRKPQD